MAWSPPQICEAILAGVLVGLFNWGVLDGNCWGLCVALGGDSSDDDSEGDIEEASASSTSLVASEADAADRPHHHAAPS
jgi:hypothetical protein